VLASLEEQNLQVGKLRVGKLQEESLQVGSLRVGSLQEENLLVVGKLQVGIRQVDSVPEDLSSEK
jgi:hypothetical protein